MNIIKTFDELKKIHEKTKQLLELRIHNDKHVSNVKSTDKREILVCGGTGCMSADSEKIIEDLKKYIEEAGLPDIKVSITGCFGFCEKGPIVHVLPDNVFYTQVTPSDAEEIVKEHLLQNIIIDRLLYEEPTLKEKVKTQDKMSFYKKQHRIALRNCGLINPEDIYESIAAEGYMALGKVLTKMTKEEVIQEMISSGLRGRGGAGFSTGQKWLFAKRSVNEKKYIVCNADEGDPGAFMDRSILEGDPNSVIEAMAIAAYAIGADEGNITLQTSMRLRLSAKKSLKS